MTTAESIDDLELAAFVERLNSSAGRHEKSLKLIENRIGLEDGFVRRLLDETDDWAFIIKTAVVVESALGQVVGETLIEEVFDRHIRSLPMDGRTGKIQLAQDLGLIGPKSAARFRAICEVRNQFAHGLKAVKSSMSEYFSQMGEADFDLLVVRFFSRDERKAAQSAEEGTKSKGGRSVEDRRDGRIGRYLLWTSACVALLELSEAQRKIDADRSWRDALVELGQAFLARHKGDQATSKQHMREALNKLESLVDAS